MQTDVLKNYFKANQIIILRSLLILTSFSSIYLYTELSALQDNPQKAVQDETRQLVAKIGELIVLPENEQPTVATVSDPEKLKSQPFFAKAERGFKVLIYANIGKSILYDPFNHRVVEVASFNAGVTPAPSPASSPTTLPIRR